MNIKVYGILFLFILSLFGIQVKSQNFNQVLKAVAFDREVDDAYGISVSVSGNYAVIGANDEDDDEFGKNKLESAGSAYLYKKDAKGQWMFEKKLVSPNRKAKGRFGGVVSIWKNRMAISGSNQVYVYEEINGSWTIVQILQAEDNTYNPSFGFSLSLKDSNLIVGSWGSVDTMNQNGASGLAFVYDLSRTTKKFELSGILRVPKNAGSSTFPRDVDIDGNIAIASDDYTGAYDKKGNYIEGSGVTYVYEKKGNVWSFKQTILPDDIKKNDNLGHSIAVRNNTIFVGCHYADYYKNGQEIGGSAGVVYIFRKNRNDSWVLNQKLAPTENFTYRQFGHSIDVDSGILLVGANIFDNFKGAAFIFREDETGRYNLAQKIQALDKGGLCEYGYSVAICKNDILVGARAESKDKTGKNILSGAGAAYFYGSFKPSYLSGNVYHDKNKNCQFDSSEMGLRFPVFTQFQATYPEESGHFTTPLQDSINYIVRVAFPNKNKIILDNYCPENYQIELNGHDSSGFDFGIKTKKDCPIIHSDVMAVRRRPCFRSSTNILVKNDGFAASEPLKVYILQPEYVYTISSNLNYQKLNEHLFVFEPGTLKPKESIIIRVTDSVACINEINNLLQCTRVLATPLNDCLRSLDSNWAESSNVIIVANGSNKNGVVALTIKNMGGKDMLSAQEFRVFKNNSLFDYGTFKLSAGDSIRLYYKSEPLTYRIEADQVATYPGFKYSAFEFYNGTVRDNIPLQNFINRLPMPEFTGEMSSFCAQIRNSFDPNDKQVSPIGVGENHVLPPESELDYTIRFQNTGTDTAFDVLVIDTLDNSLDFETFEGGISSSPYNLILAKTDKFILKFYFKNIYLPDSHVNELGSHGFLKFKIKTKSGLTPQATIGNFADIYFDFNEAIRTDTSTITIDSLYFTYPNREKTALGGTVLVFPNPSEGKFNFLFDSELPNEIRLFDISGKALFTHTIHNKFESIDISALGTGLYFAKVVWANHEKTCKLLKFNSN